MKTIYLLLICLCCSIAHAQTFRVVNMIPNTESNETNQDSEPSLTVNPNNPQEVIGTAFTPNPNGVLTVAPIYISQDGGNTWTLNSIVPSGNGMTGDITVGLSRNNTLYAGILSGGAGLQMQILRDNTYTVAGAMQVLLTRNNEDQPYLKTITPLGGPLRNNDLLYVGHNDFNAAAGRTASIEQSMNAATAPPPAGLTTVRLEVRNTNGQDGPPIRSATHPNGTVYAMFYRRTASVGTTRTGDITVVRDDNWGQGALPLVNPYGFITDPGDGLAGVLVAQNISWVWNNGAAMGQERLGDRCSIAVDPRNSQTVYIAYLDLPAGNPANTTTLHVRRSTNGGVTWSNDLLTVNNVIVPQLAINIRGTVGLLYQQLTPQVFGQNWVTHFRQNTNAAATNWNDNILSNTPSNVPVRAFGPYLGDYAGLEAVGKDFYGNFSANNTPNVANFPNGVTFQRNTQGLQLRNFNNTANVPISIDPFFFEAEQIPDNRDFYVRDWTTNTTTFDIGLEPSTNPIFYTTSDIWNRRSNTAGGFNGNDQPNNENPWISTSGSNYAFARVHRKGTGVSETVTLHFLKSEFGTGSNYVDANTTADPTLSFASGESVKTMTSGYEWELIATNSTHVCLAVEINTPTDPVVTPTLLGRAPGWPNTDLAVLYDNNKAQRNLGVFSGGGSPGGNTGGTNDDNTTTYYAVVHNAALHPRNMVLQFQPNKSFIKIAGRNPQLSFPGSKPKLNVVDSTNTLTLKNMQPGENRWVGITVPVLPDGLKIPVEIAFSEMKDRMPINGFTLRLQASRVEQTFMENYRLHHEVFFRMGKMFDSRYAIVESKSIDESLIQRKAGDEWYLDYMKAHIRTMASLTKEVMKQNDYGDPFELNKALEQLKEHIGKTNIHGMTIAHRNFNHRMDAYLTYLDKQKGDIADILQNVRWQRKLYTTNKVLTNIKGSKSVVGSSKTFEEEYGKGTGPEKYPAFIQRIWPVLEATVATDEGSMAGLKYPFEWMKRVKDNPQELQKAHRKFLLKLEGL